MTATELYHAELERSDYEHHHPTAGAVIGHITSNLLLHTLKIEQAKLFARGTAVLFFAQKGNAWEDTEFAFIRKLNRELLAEGDLIPTTSKEVLEFGRLEEDGSRKYKDGNEQLFDLVKDFDTQLLYIGKGLALAKQEGHLGQVAALTDLANWMKGEIAFAQNFLGHDLKEGLYVEEDDDDDEED